MSQLARSSAWPMAVASAATLLLAACGGGGGSGTDSGTLKLALTDAPACGYDNVYVTVKSIEVHRSDKAAEDGWNPIPLFSKPKQIDLLNLRNGVLEELAQTALPAGHYNQMRLVLSDAPGANAVTPSGSPTVALTTPSAQQSGLKLNVDITIEAGKLADFVLDFDACKSVVKAGSPNKYNLKPVISVLPRFINGMAVDGYVGSSSPYTSVSLQLNGVVVRSTVPNQNGFFALPYLPDSGTNYDLVIADPARGTRVVSAVPVTPTEVTHIGTQAQPVPLENSAGQDLSVTVTSGSVLPDATISVHQELAVGRQIELASRSVESQGGSASFRLATAPVQFAGYVSAPASFAWQTYDASAAQFTVRSYVPGIDPQLQPEPADLRLGSDSVSFSY